MMFKKIATVACLASAMSMVSAPASAAAYFIGGKWYYFSIDFEADLAKVTGKDVKDGTRVQVAAKITNSNVQCGNPQGQLISGVGPTGTVTGTSKFVDPADQVLIRDNRVKGNVYKSTTQVTKLVANGLKPDFGCENSAGNGNFVPVYWRYLNCNKGGITGFPEACYQERAVATSFDTNGVATALMYSTGPRWREAITGDDINNWTYVYLPTAFNYRATIEVLTDATTTPPTYTTTTEPDGRQFGSCSFPANNEPGAAYYGQTYSLNNPPVNGWAATPIDFTCGPITETDYNNTP